VGVERRGLFLGAVPGIVEERRLSLPRRSEVSAEAIDDPLASRLPVGQDLECQVAHRHPAFKIPAHRADVVDTAGELADGLGIVVDTNEKGM
jgi:hypothetical protein